ncbi:MAG TPA: thioredoxin family protein [Fimbriiglobus sp.]|jgi:thioredoxin-like negative regulator of GroEL
MVGNASRPIGLLTVCLFAAVGSAADPTILWRTDYASAMKESADKKMPILVVVGSDACTHCRRMDAETFEDEKVRADLIGRFVTLKIDATKEPGLVQALNVQLYPTCVLAGPDGKIHGYLQGFQTADDLRTHLARVVAAVKKK